MSVRAHLFLSPEEYLAGEREADFKSEYLNGEVFAMAGASATHVLIATNVSGELRARLRGGPCGVFGSDLRVQAGEGQMYAYPDVTVVCGEPQFLDDRRDTVLNPTVLVEVLSPSTEKFDRGAKFAYYRHVETLRDYLLIAQDRPRVEHYQREEGGQWRGSVVEGASTSVVLASLGCELPLSEIYHRAAFPPLDQ